MSKIKWAVNLFKEWQTNRNEQALNPAKAMDISPITVTLEEMTVDEINYTVSRFICEVRKANGTEYPADTLYSLVMCIQLYMDHIGKNYKFLNDESFIQIKNTLDNVMKANSRNPEIKPRKQAQIITVAEEDALWDNGVLGSDTPKTLLHTMVYVNGLNFALRGGIEQRNLRAGPTSQLSVGSNEEGRFLCYRQDVSKTNQGGLQHRNVSPKIVLAFENLENPERCIVRLYEKYISHLPENTTNTAFYLRPLDKPRGHVWFGAQSVGRHKLDTVVAEICKDGNLLGYRTNHSLRASAATRMFDAEVDEQLICEVTGHRSSAVRSYKRTNTAQKRKMSAIVQGQSDCAQTVKKCCTTQSNADADVSVTVNVSVKKN